MECGYINIDLDSRSFLFSSGLLLWLFFDFFFFTLRDFLLFGRCFGFCFGFFALPCLHLSLVILFLWFFCFLFTFTSWLINIDTELLEISLKKCDKISILFIKLDTLLCISFFLSRVVHQ